MKLWLVLAGCVLLVAVSASSAGATGSPSGGWDHPCTEDVNIASCERLTYIAQRQDDALTVTAEASNALHGDLWVLVGVCAFGGLGAVLLRAFNWQEGRV